MVHTSEKKKFCYLNFQLKRNYNAENTLSGVSMEEA